MKNQKVLLTTLFLALFISTSLAYGGKITEENMVFKQDDKRYNKTYLSNCVEYARWYLKTHDGINMPSGFLTLENKKSKIKSNKPKKKSVAIINVGTYGHVAYVADIDDSGKNKSITLYEANYPSGVERKRIIKGNDVSMKELEKYAKILGYWKP